jgi:hypothetical protein
MSAWIVWNIAEKENSEMSVTGAMSNKITVPIPEFDLFPHSRITPKSRFYLIYSYRDLELFPRRQSMQVHDLAKDEWLLFTEWNGWDLFMEIAIYND